MRLRRRVATALRSTTTVAHATAGVVQAVLTSPWRTACLKAEVLFLRRQLAMYQERGLRPRRPSPAGRVILALMSRLFDWREALVVVQPATLVRWHRLGSRRLVHVNVTAHPSSAWVAQQLREAIPDDHRYRFLLHDRDAVFQAQADGTARSFGLRVVRTPVRAPRANAFCEHLIGTLRRECLDWLIPLGERHLRMILREWMEHYNRGRPHSSLGPGLPGPPDDLPVPPQPKRHEPPPSARVMSSSVLGGLHHDYRLVA